VKKLSTQQREIQHLLVPGVRRDAAFYYLGETMIKVNLRPQAVGMFERLVKEFQTSEYLKKAQKRLAEIKPSVKPPAEIKR